MQSYFTKTAKAALLSSLALTTGYLLIALLAIAFTLDAVYGLYILQYVYKKSTNHQTVDNLIDENEETENIEFDERINEDKKVKKIFRKGWK
jgi:hypothetical protein